MVDFKVSWIVTPQPDRQKVHALVKLLHGIGLLLEVFPFHIFDFKFVRIVIVFQNNCLSKDRSQITKMNGEKERH